LSDLVAEAITNFVSSFCFIFFQLISLFLSFSGWCKKKELKCLTTESQPPAFRLGLAATFLLFFVRFSFLLLFTIYAEGRSLPPVLAAYC
jgi:hypothetical protein